MTSISRVTPRGGYSGGVIAHHPRLPRAVAGYRNRSQVTTRTRALYYIVNIIYYKLIHNIDYYSKYIVTTYIIYFTIRQKAIDTYGIIGS